MTRPLKRMGIGLLSLAVVTAAAVSLLTPAAPTRAADDQAKARVGQPAPNFTLDDTDGNAHSLSDYKGRIVVLHFQSCHCPWDGAYQPHLNDLAKKFADAGKDGKEPEVVFLSINANSNESVDLIKSYKQRVHVEHPMLKDPHNEVADAYGARTTPHMYVIDAKGVLRYMGGVEEPPVSVSDVGHMKTQYLEPVIEALVKGQDPPYTSTKSKGCTIRRQR